MKIVFGDIRPKKESVIDFRSCECGTIVKEKAEKKLIDIDISSDISISNR